MMAACDTRYLSPPILSPSAAQTVGTGPEHAVRTAYLRPEANLPRWASYSRLSASGLRSMHRNMLHLLTPAVERLKTVHVVHP